MTGTPDSLGPQFGNQREPITVRQLAIEQDRPIVIDGNGFLGISQRRDVVNDHIVVLQGDGERRCHLRFVLHQQHAQ